MKSEDVINWDASTLMLANFQKFPVVGKDPILVADSCLQLEGDVFWRVEVKAPCIRKRRLLGLR
jgi:hypothetical protein